MTEELDDRSRDAAIFNDDDTVTYLHTAVDVIVKTKYIRASRTIFILKGRFNEETYMEDIKKDIERSIKPGTFTFTARVIEESDRVPF